MEDVLIIGAGPAACAAAIYCSRAMLKTVFCGNPKESGLWTSAGVQNYPGFLEPVPGPELLTTMIEQAKKYGATHREESVVDARKKEGGFTVTLGNGETLEAKILIIACGKGYITTGIKGESHLKGKGVFYCVACDGPLMKDKKVAVIGSGDYAASEAIELSSFTKNVTLISNGPPFAFNEKFADAVRDKKITMVQDKLTAINGVDRIESVSLQSGGVTPFEGMFVALGTANALAFANKLGMMMKGEDLVVDGNGMSSLDGVYAAGMCTGAYNQIPVSTGGGVTAAISIIKRLKGLASYIDQT